MGEVSLTGWLLFSAVVLAASVAGVALSALVPWRDEAVRSNLPVSAGLLAGPFLTGLGAVFSLAFFPGGSHEQHLVIVMALLLAITLISRWLANRRWSRSDNSSADASPVLAGSASEPGQSRGWQAGWLLLLGLWLLSLLVNATQLPLLQNDSLEYATVGRELFHARSFDVYPLLDSEHSLSGFFAPWTHPPLYVSLVYLMNVFQGHASEPGLMRLIAPWFLITAVYCLTCIGRLHSWRLGLMAAVSLISAPLLFLGADSALLDALPVAGFVLIIAVMLGVKSDSKMYGLAIGLALGLALWTHSQAILLIGLLAVAVVAQFGFLQPVRIIRVLSLAGLVALAVAAAPYIRNYLIFGSPISDNPLVFAMPELDWRGYFEFNRGLDHPVAIVQYGIFKGWFSLEAYGPVFWIWLLGLVFWFWLLGVKGLWQLASKGYESDVLAGMGVCGAARPVICLSFVLALTYLAGVVVSVAIGVDLMIRNERYMLMIVPALALGAAYALDCMLSWLFDRSRASRWKVLRYPFVMALALVLVLQWVVVGVFYRWRSPELASLSNWSNIRVIEAINRTVPQDGLVLSSRPSDMYYAKRRMVSYLDERMLAFYAQTEPVKALEELRKLGVRYVQLTDYALPPVYNSSLLEILADPKMSRLVFSSDGDQLYELVGEPPETVADLPIDLLHTPWHQVRQIRLGGRKVLETFGVDAQPLQLPASVSDLAWFHRDYSTMLIPGGAQSLQSADVSTMVSVEPGQYLLRLQVQGRGYVQVWMGRFGPDGQRYLSDTTSQDGQIRVGDFSLTDRKSSMTFVRRIQIREPVKFVRFAIEHAGMSRLTVNSMTLTPLLTAPTGASASAASSPAVVQGQKGALAK